MIDPYVYQEALDLMAEHRAVGRPLYIVSSSPEEIVRPLARHFGVAGVIATRAEVSGDNRYTGELEFYAYGELKAQAIRELAERAGLDLEASFAYSDSATDLPMLEAVGHPVAVNPDKDLRKVAEERSWEILQFRRPVRLRSRIASAVPAGKPTVAAAAAGAVAVAAVLAWVVVRQAGRRRGGNAAAALARRHAALGSAPGGRPRSAESSRGGMTQDPGAACARLPGHVHASA